MKKFKIIDYRISMLLITIFAVISFIKWDSTFIIGYVVTGAWQIMSMILHVYNRWFIRVGSARNIYHWIVFVSVLTLPAGSYVILLFTAPFMAVYYTYICYDEVTVKMQRPLALLK